MLKPNSVRAWLYIGFFGFVILPILANASQDQGFFWEVENGEYPLYLMGSIHFANEDFYPFRDPIESAFIRADKLVVELDVQTQDTLVAQKLLTQLGNYLPPDTLANHLRPQTLAALKKHLERSGLPFQLFERQKPGLVVIALTTLELAKMGLSPEQGIDLYFLRKARGIKKIVELETLEEQLSALLADEYGEVMLRQTLAEMGEYSRLIDSLLTSWKEGDVAALEELLINKPLREFPESRASFDRLFTQRNQRMTEKISGYLQNPERYFVVVGAGHMLGKTGIVELLRKKGYRVTQR